MSATSTPNSTDAAPPVDSVSQVVPRGQLQKGIANRVKRTYKRVGYLRFSKQAEAMIASGSIFFGLVEVEKLRQQIKQAGWEVSLRGYIGMTLLGAWLTVFLSVVVSILSVVALSALGTDITMAVLVLPLGVVGGLVLAFCVLYFSTIFPSFFISGRASEIDRSMPTVASYMSAMTTSGVPPAPIFASLAKERSISKVISDEASRINRDIEVLGLDILKALEQAAFRSPSDRWKGFLEGIIATVTSGGDLSTYLATETKAAMKLKAEESKAFIEELGVMAEIFMILGVVTPLFFVVMIAILSILSDAGSSLALLIGITYIVVPSLMFVMMVLLDTTGASKAD